LIIDRGGMFFFYTQSIVVRHVHGLIIAHAHSGAFVIITVTATLAGFDRTLFLSRASALGASPSKCSSTFVIPLIRPA